MTVSSEDINLKPFVLLLVNAVSFFRVGMNPGPNQTAADDESDNVEEDVDAADPEAKSEHFMAILVECMALLNSVPDTVEVSTCLKER
jgi:hypothetical protein